MLAVDRDSPPHAGSIGDEIVVPHVAAVLPRHVHAEPAEDDDVLERRSLGSGPVRSLLRRDGAPAPGERVTGDEHRRTGVDQPARHGGSREAREDRHRERAERGDGIQGGCGLGHHRQEEGDRVSLAHAEVVEALRETGRLPRQLGVRPASGDALLALPGDGVAGRVRGVVGEALDAGVGQVQATAHEPPRPLGPRRLVEHLAVRLCERQREVLHDGIPEAAEIGDRRGVQLVVPAGDAEAARQPAGVRAAERAVQRFPDRLVVHAVTLSSAGVRAAVFQDPSDGISIEELVVDPPGAGEIEVRMLAAGVCHSDLHTRDGDWPLARLTVLGHEGAAEVASVGEGVEGLAPGDRVVLSWNAPCGTCLRCVTGRPWLCVDTGAQRHAMTDGTTRLHRSSGEDVWPTAASASSASERSCPRPRRSACLRRHRPEWRR